MCPSRGVLGVVARRWPAGDDSGTGMLAPKLSHPRHVSRTFRVLDRAEGVFTPQSSAVMFNRAVCPPLAVVARPHGGTTHHPRPSPPLAGITLASVVVVMGDRAAPGPVVRSQIVPNRLVLSCCPNRHLYRIKATMAA